MVCILVPLPPRPLSDYQQLGSNRAPSVQSEVMGPPSATSPAYTPYTASPAPSIRPSNSRRNFEVERLGVLLNASQEDLRTHQQQSIEDSAMMRQRYQDRENRLRAEFEKERQIYLSQIASLESALADRDQEIQELTANLSAPRGGRSLMNLSVAEREQQTEPMCSGLSVRLNHCL
jgi:hypothetical protein